MPDGNLFAVIRTRGPQWQHSLPLESQENWAGHAAFMNALQNGGFIVLGGPLDGTSDVLLIVRANTPEEIADRLQADPWVASDLLHLTRVAPWVIRLGSL